MFPAKVEDPMIRGEIIVQTLKDINEEATYSSQGNPGKTFLQALQKDFQLIKRIGDIRNKGKLLKFSLNAYLGPYICKVSHNIFPLYLLCQNCLSKLSDLIYLLFFEK
jgi:hypothetical protein